MTDLSTEIMDRHYRLRWLKSIYPEFKGSDWNYDNVYKPDDLKYFAFFQEIRTYNTIIDPGQIIGIEYPYEYNCYYNINWLELVLKLKRLDWVINNFKTKESVIRHIHEANAEKIVFKYGNNYFTREGQHRLCLAKFLDIKEIEVTVLEYHLNRERLMRYKILKKMMTYGIIDKHSDDILKDMSKWSLIHLKIKDVHIRIKQELLVDFTVYYESVKNNKFLNKLQYKIYCVTKKNRNRVNIDIDTKSSFKVLKSLIYAHKLGNDIPIKLI